MTTKKILIINPSNQSNYRSRSLDSLINIAHTVLEHRPPGLEGLLSLSQKFFQTKHNKKRKIFPNGSMRLGVNKSKYENENQVNLVEYNIDVDSTKPVGSEAPLLETNKLSEIFNGGNNISSASKKSEFSFDFLSSDDESEEVVENRQREKAEKDDKPKRRKVDNEVIEISGFNVEDSDLKNEKVYIEKLISKLPDDPDTRFQFVRNIKLFFNFPMNVIINTSMLFEALNTFFSIFSGSPLANDEEFLQNALNFLILKLRKRFFYISSIKNYFDNFLQENSSKLFSSISDSTDRQDFLSYFRNVISSIYPRNPEVLQNILKSCANITSPDPDSAGLTYSQLSIAKLFQSNLPEPISLPNLSRLYKSAQLNSSSSS